MKYGRIPPTGPPGQRNLAPLVLGVLVSAAALLLDAQQNAPVGELGVDGAHRLDVRRGQPGRLRVRLLSEEVLRFDFDAGDFGFDLSVKAPDGRDLLRTEGISGAYGPLPVSLLAPVAGDYEIRVEAVEDAAGPCMITVRERRSQVPTDEDHILIQNSIFEGSNLTKQGGADSLRAAVNRLTTAREKSQANGDPLSQALALSLLGRAQLLQAQFKIAEATLSAAVDIWNQVGNRKAEAQAMTQLGEAQRNLGQTDTALEVHQRALLIRREVADRRGEADTLNGIGVIRFTRSDVPGALEAFDAASKIRWDLGDRTGLIATLNNIAAVHNSTGETRVAIESYEQALALLASAPNQRFEGALLVNLGRAYWSLAQYQKALDFDQRALALDRLLKDQRAEGIALNNLGAVHETLGNHERALDYYTQSLAIKRTTGDRRGEAITLTNLGMVKISQRQYRAAMDQFAAALPVLREVGDRITEGNALNNIGDAHSGLQEYEAAIDSLRQALALRNDTRDRPGQAYSYNSLGAVYLRLKQYPQALDNYERALALSEEVGDSNTELGARYGMAQAQAALGNLGKAYALVESALRIVESSRTQVVLQDLRTSYFASRHECYEFAVDLLMRLHAQQPAKGYAAKALEVHERAQARSLIEMIRESGADIRRGVPPELLTRERTLREHLSASIERRLRSLVGNEGRPASAANAKEIDAVSHELEEVESEIRVKSPAYASLTQPAPLSAAEIQRELGAGPVALLEYSLGGDRSYGWLVTSASIQAFELPTRSKVEQAGRRFYDLVAMRDGGLGSESAGNHENGAARAREAEQLAGRLGAMLLGPVAKEIHGRPLVIVPDGILSYLPLNALGEPGQGSQYTPLLMNHAISSLPSASVLSVIRNQNSSRQPAPEMLAVVADPVFDRSDPRIHPQTKPAGSPPAAVSGARDYPEARAPQASALSRLAFSRREAEAIASLIPGVRTLLDFDATLDAVTSPDMARYRIVHLATHGFLDSDHPEQSALVLSLVDQGGNPRQGFLPVADIFNLNLPAELVVLSACQTALGKDIRGEGLVGLTRAFMYAGATRVIASLWKVDDLATAGLMAAFYRRLAGGANPVDALRAARLELLKNSAWSSPYYWAGFELQGEFEGSPALRLRH